MITKNKERKPEHWRTRVNPRTTGSMLGEIPAKTIHRRFNSQAVCNTKGTQADGLKKGTRAQIHRRFIYKKTSTHAQKNDHKNKERKPEHWRTRKQYTAQVITRNNLIRLRD